MNDSKKLGEILLEEGMITEEQLEKAIAEQLKSYDSLGVILIKLGFITEDVLYHFLAMQYSVKFVDVGILSLDEDTIKTISGDTARKYNIIPIEKKPGKIIFATTNLENPALQVSLKYDVPDSKDHDFSYVLTTQVALNETIEKYYPIDSVVNEALKAIEGSSENLEIEIMEDKKAKDDEAEEGDIEGAGSPVVRFVNLMIEEAVKKKASDIHVNFYEKKIVLRYRIDGSLVEMPPPPVMYKRALISRMKLISGLNIIERRMPQDGRIHYKLPGNDNKVIDLRVSTLPSIWGENIVMRLLYSESQNLDLAKLGLSEKQLAIIDHALAAPYGMVLITGPTGSGKSTTLYSMISRINNPDTNIMTAEDPVEYRLPHLIQVQINPVAGLTFPNVLRSFLRQDPDIILVGEIRDGETASIAVKSALTGHLVLSTLHTNDAPSTIIRLVDMGIDPIYVGSSVVMVIAQKLVRKICSQCSEPIKEIDLVKAKKGGIPVELLEGGTFFEGKGCPTCNYTGYKGRMAAYEIMPINTAIRDIIFKHGTLNDVKRAAWEQGLTTIRESAIRILKEGKTTLEEVLAETLQDKPLKDFLDRIKL